MPERCRFRFYLLAVTNVSVAKSSAGGRILKA
jgi:hypothetical protein